MQDKKVEIKTLDQKEMDKKVELDTLDQICYQGTTNSLELSKIEEWATGYGINKDALVQTIPVILEGGAVDWWNTTPRQLPFPEIW